MHIRHHDALIEVQTPAKVNLFLEVLRRREDGFHEIETLISPLDLCDTLRFKSRSDGCIQATCHWTSGRQATAGSAKTAEAKVWSDLPQGDDNLVVRAIRCLREKAEITVGADMQLIKRIPAAAGLGGASSDAAAALVAANAAWKLGWSREALSEVAAEIGSDVPFFLTGSSAVCRGRGEQIQAIETRGRLWLVVVRPPVGLSTAAVYRDCRPAIVENEQEWATTDQDAESADSIRSIDRLLTAIQCGDSVRIARQMFNRLQAAAELHSPWIERLRVVFDGVDCLGHQMSGSGSSYFGICRNLGHARRVAGRLSSADLGAVFVTAALASRPLPLMN